MSRSLHIAVADDEPGMREFLRELLPRLGHEVVVAENGRQLVELCRAAPPDLVITDIKMDDLDGLEAAAQVNHDRPVPVILLSGYHDEELLGRARQAHIMAYLVKPVKQEDLVTAIDLAMARFEQFQSLRREAADLRQALEDRKLIERAKGVVMRRAGAGEEEAFRCLQRLASDRNHKLVEVARTVVDAEEVFAALERTPEPVHATRGRRAGRRPA